MEGDPGSEDCEQHEENHDDRAGRGQPIVAEFGPDGDRFRRDPAARNDNSPTASPGIWMGSLTLDPPGLVQSIHRPQAHRKRIRGSTTA